MILKKVFTLALFLMSAPLVVQADPPATHGMLVLGEKQVYLSHLPMFHSPHDYQAIFAVTFEPGALQAYLTAKQTAPKDTIFTIVPEPFSLDQMLKSPHPFHAQIYQGHFERGGKPITGSIGVRIDQIVFAKHLSPSEPRPVSAKYLLFGSSSEFFLAHLITGGPNFDQVSQALVRNPPSNAGSMTVTFPSVSDLAPPSMSVLGSSKPDLFLGLHKIYEETGDLELMH